MSTPSETCPICGGTGWQTIERGKEREAVRCECRVQGRTERLLAAAHIPKRYQRCAGDNFHHDQGDGLTRAWLAAKYLSEHYPAETSGLLFVGPAGVGKTHLAVAIIRDLIRDHGAHCLFCDYRELLESIRNSYNPSVQATEMEILRPVLDAEVLLLDDLGAVRSTEWVFDTISYILNNRHNDKKTTIITTNYPDGPEQEELDDYSSSSSSSASSSSSSLARRAVRPETLGDRIGYRMRSRLHDMCKRIEMNGPDYRLSTKKGDFKPDL